MKRSCRLQVAGCKPQAGARVRGGVLYDDPAGEVSRSGTGGGAPSIKKSAFTLMELSIVVMVLALLAAAALRYATVVRDSNNIAATNATLDVIDAALFNFRAQNTRLPCPADLNTYGENMTYNNSGTTVAPFGWEAGTFVGGTGSGECYNPAWVPTAAYKNSGTDPDAAGGWDVNGGSADPYYDSGTSGMVEAGGVPTKTLGIADKYAYDAWGRRILYVVDKRITATGAFNSYTVASGTIGAIVVKKVGVYPSNPPYSDTLANAITYKGIYALVSFGKNGHGGYTRTLSVAPVPVNAGSTNPDQLKNCHCTNTGAAAVSAPYLFDRIFVQKARTSSGTASLLNTFDDIVRYKNRNEVIINSEEN